MRSLAHWLTWQAGMSPGHAREVVRLAEARETHPAVMSSFAAGAMSVDQAAVATRGPAYLDSQFAETAPWPRCRNCARWSGLHGRSRWRRTNPTAPEESLACWFDDDGRYRLRGELDADHGRIIDSALTEARDALFHAGQPKVTWAHALVEMAQRWLDAVPTEERRERFRANWFIDPTNPLPAHWRDGLAGARVAARLLSCDGTMAPVFTEAARPVCVGRTQRAIPDRTRRLVLARDAKCRVPWCSQTRWLQVHHVVHQADGGGHDTPNLIAICPADHRLHHLGLLGISGNADDPDGLVFTDPAGRVIDPAARPAIPTGPPPAPAKPYEHPLGERLQRWAVVFPDPPDPPEPHPPDRHAAQWRSTTSRRNWRTP